MRSLRSLWGGVIAVGLMMAPAVAQEENPLPNENWSFTKLFGSFDLAAAQRGFQIYSNVCSNCHSMQLLHYRDLSGIGLDANQIKAIAAGVTVPQGLDDQGNPMDRPLPPASSNRLSPTKKPLGQLITVLCHRICR
jgi:ubiquinol-cytochrome c reductase cytochrome c1 subunit